MKIKLNAELDKALGNEILRQLKEKIDFLEIADISVNDLHVTFTVTIATIAEIVKEVI